MKNLKKAALIALSALMILALAACGKSGNKVVYRTLDEIRDSGTVNIGVFSDKNPFGYVDENGEYQGYDVYFARRLAEDLGVSSIWSPPRPPTASNISRPGRWTSSWPTSPSPPSGPKKWTSLSPT